MAANFRCLYLFRENCKMLKSLKLYVKHLMILLYIYKNVIYICIICIYILYIYIHTYIYIFIRSICCGQQLFRPLRAHQQSSDKIEILRIYMYIKIYMYIYNIYIYIYNIIYIYIYIYIYI